MKRRFQSVAGRDALRPSRLLLDGNSSVCHLLRLTTSSPTEKGFPGGLVRLNSVSKQLIM